MKKFVDLYSHADEQFKHMIDIEVDKCVHARIRKGGPSIMFRYLLVHNFNLKTIKAAISAYENGEIRYQNKTGEIIWVSCRLDKKTYDDFRTKVRRNNLGTVDHVARILLLYLMRDQEEEKKDEN